VRRKEHQNRTDHRTRQAQGQAFREEGVTVLEETGAIGSEWSSATKTTHRR
jgi:hypothetical protein